jgi:hypothetical protein
MKKTKRTAFTWDQEYKAEIPNIRREILGWGDKDNTITNGELFFLCVAMGFSNDTRRPVPARTSDSVRLEDLSADSESMLKIVAISDSETPEDLIDEDLLFDRIESFAAGGLMLLADAVQKEKNFKDWLLNQLLTFGNLNIQ